jgi:FlaG/FlaF family flagellin (archaellin)
MAERRFLPPPRVKPEAKASAHPWVIPVIVAVAIVVVLAGVVWASVLGHFF